MAIVATMDMANFIGMGNYIVLTESLMRCLEAIFHLAYRFFIIVIILHV